MFILWQTHVSSFWHHMRLHIIISRLGFTHISLAFWDSLLVKHFHLHLMRESWLNISWSCCDEDIISAIRVIIHKRDKMSDKIFQEFWGTHNCSNTLFIFILRVNVWVNCSIIVKWEAALCFKAHGDVPMYL